MTVVVISKSSVRIPVEPNSNSGLQANSDSGNIRTPIPVLSEQVHRLTPALSVKLL